MVISPEKKINKENHDNNENSAKPLRTIRSFVRRQGRLTSNQRQALEILWNEYGLSTQLGQISFETSFGRQAQTVLEVGFGNGESLLNMAISQPEVNFIGIEVHLPGVGSLLQKINYYGLKNLRIYREDAVEVLARCIPEHSLTKVQIFFPDPWPKKRHHKRRLIQPNFIELLNSRLMSGGELHLATDWQDYAHHMQKIILTYPNWQLISEKAQIGSQSLRMQTKFEQRGRRLGFDIFDLIFYKL